MLDVRLEKTLNATSAAPFKLELRFEAASGILILFGASGQENRLRCNCWRGCKLQTEGAFGSVGRLSSTARSRSMFQ